MIERISSFFLIVVLSLLNCGSVFAESTKQVVIGVVAPMTGPVAAVGESIHRSLELAARDGDFKNTKFVFEDDQFIPKNTVAGVKKLIDVDHVDGLIVFGSGPALAVADTVERSGILTFAMAYSDEITKGRPHIFRTFLTATTQADVIKSEAKARKYSSVGVVSSTNQAMAAVKTAIEQSLPVKPSISIEVEPDDKDLQVIAAKAIRANPDALLLLLVPPQNSILSGILRNHGWEGNFFSSSHLNNPSEITAAKGALRGTWFVTIDDSTGVAFRSEYAAVYGKAPMIDGAIACDVGKFLVESLQTEKPLEHLAAATGFQGRYGKWKRTTSQTFEPPTKVAEITE